MTRNLNIFLVTFTISMLFFTFWLFGLVLFLHDIRSTPNQSQRQNSAEITDAIIVLTGGQNRVDAGLDLLKSKKSKELFISGVHKDVTVQDLLNLWQKDTSKVPCCITLGYQAQNTKENAKEVSDWLKEKNYHHIRLVTAHYHMKRSLLELKSLKQNNNLTIIEHPIAPSNFKIDHWWQIPLYRNLILKEYHKYIIACIHYAIIGK